MHGKSQLQRVAALLLALLHPTAVVGYCEYRRYSLSPLQLLTLGATSHLPSPSSSASLPDLVSALREQQRFIVFFADEVQHLYYRRQRDALDQVCLVSRTSFCARSPCE